MVRNFVLAIAMTAIWSVSAATVSAQFGDGNSANNLFSQYYTQPGASMTQAGMYNAPHYVPGNVGHSYYTYQPLMPHEMMYQHSRNYYNYYNTGGYYGGPNALNKTTVRWQSGSNHMGPMPFTGNLMQAAKWKYYSHRYCLGGNCGLGYHGGMGGGVGSRLHGLGGCAGGACYGTTDSYGGESYGDVYSYEGSHGGEFSGCQNGGCLSKNGGSSIQR